MVAIVDVIGRKGDSLMTQRNKVLDTFRAGCARLVIRKSQPLVVKMISQHHCRKTFVRNRPCDIAIGHGRSQDGTADTLAEKELGIGLVRTLVASKVDDVQIVTAFQHSGYDTVDARRIVRRPHSKRPRVDQRHRRGGSTTNRRRIATARNRVEHPVSQLRGDGGTAVDHAGNRRNRDSGLLSNSADGRHVTCETK